MKRVAVTGLGALTPVGNSVPAFWSALLDGKNGIAPISCFDTTGTKFTLAAQLKDFDPAARFEKAELAKLDLFSMYALTAAAEAVADSGIEGRVEPERLGVWFGSGIGGFNTLCNEHKNLLERGPRRVSPLFISKMIYNIAAGNIAIRFKAKGPCVCVSTACATGTTAIGEAYRAIAFGDADAVICGGAEAAVTPLGIAGFGACMTLSPATDPDAASLPFDARRVGFVMGEGAGAMVLEEYEHALARGASIYAEVKGYGCTCDAYHVTAPDPGAQRSAAAIAMALRGVAGTDAERIYFNAHGTGTPLNDAAETLAIKKAFGDAAGALHISSTKSMTGHMLGAAGAVEAIAAVLAIGCGAVPPTINLREPDPACDLDYTPGSALRAPIDAALSVSLGFGGHNACVAFARP